MRFYNPGTAISDSLAYTHPLKDPKIENTVSYFLLKVGEKEFVDVPSTLTLQTDEGESSVSVNFVKRVKLQYMDRGLVMVDPRLEDTDIADEDNAAANDADARKKGAAMWKDYLKAIVTQHYATVQEIKQAGGVPRAAKGLVVYALKALHMEDPADQVDTITRAREGQTDNKALQDQLRDALDRINRLEGAQGAAAQQTMPKE